MQPPPPNNAPFSLLNLANHKKDNLTLNNEWNIQLNFPWTNNIIATMNTNTADTDEDDEDDYDSLSAAIDSEFYPCCNKD